MKPGETAMVILRELAEPVGPPELPLVPVPLTLIEEVLTELHAEGRGYRSWAR